MSNIFFDQPLDFNPAQPLTLAFAGGTQSPLFYMLADISGGYSLTEISGLGGGRGDVVFGDFDGDGLEDLFAFRDYADDAVLLNDGSGGFADTGQVLNSGRFAAVDARKADIDGDGDLDILTANGIGGTRLWENDGSGAFTDHPLIGGHSLHVASADFDGNGTLDIVAARGQTFWGGSYVGNGGLSFLFNYADGGAVTQTHGPTQQISMVNVDVADFDGDGDIDVFGTARDDSPSASPQTHTLLLNDGSGNFSTGAQILASGRTLDATIGDFDGDGDMDVAHSITWIGLEIHLNDGTGSFSTQTELLPGQIVAGLASADFDNDGRDELIVSFSDYVKAYSLGSAGLTELWSVDAPARGFRIDVGSLAPVAPTLQVEEDDGALDLLLTDFIDLTSPDLDTSSITFEVDVQPDQGVVTIVDDVLTYDPGNAFQHLGEGETAEVYCQVTMTDGAGVTYTDTLTITITGSAEYCVHTVGTEFLVNSQGAADQRYPSLAGLEDGGMVVVWQTQDATQDGFDDAIMAKLYDSDGNVVLSDFLVNSTVFGDQRFPEVTALKGGGFVVTWGADYGFGPDNFDVYARVFDAAGAPLGLNFILSSSTFDEQRMPEVAALDGGGFVATWRTTDPAADGDGSAINARLFDASGMPVGTEFLVNSTTTSNQFGAQVANLANGSFIVAWTSDDPTSGGNGSDVKAQIFSASGQPQGPEISINSEVANDQNEVAIAGLPNGGFVATWTTWDASQDGSSSAIMARLFDASGLPVVHDFVVNSEATSVQFGPEVTALNGGDFIISWMGADGDLRGIKAQHFELDGTPIGDEFLVNSETADGQYYADITTLADGGYAIAWQSNDTTQDGSGASIKAVRYTPENASIVDIEVSNTTISEAEVGNTEIATLTAIGVPNSTYTYELINNPANIFVLDGDELKVRNNLYLDHDNASELALTVRATDNDGRSFDKNIELTVSAAEDGGRLTALDAITVNSQTFGYQSNPAISGLENGGYVVTWETYDGSQDGSLSAIKAQTYFADGTPLSNEFLVNTVSEHHQLDPKVAGLDGGDFVVTWTSQLDPNDFSNTAVKAQKFNSLGFKKGGEFLVSQTAGLNYFIDIVALENGGYSIVWTEEIYDNNGYSRVLKAQTFQMDGTLVGGGTVIANVSGSDVPDIASTQDGGFLVSWSDYANVHAQKLDAAGQLEGALLTVANPSEEYLTGGGITQLSNGNYVLAWRSSDFGGESTEIYAQIFGQGNVPLSSQFIVNDPNFGRKLDPKIVTLENGGFAISWGETEFYVPQTDDNYVLKAKVFTANGNLQGKQFVVSQDQSTNNWLTDFAAINDGQFVATWDNDGDVSARTFVPSSPDQFELYTDDTFTTLISYHETLQDAFDAANTGYGIDINYGDIDGEIGFPGVDVDDLTIRADEDVFGYISVDDATTITLIGDNKLDINAIGARKIIYGSDGKNNLGGTAGSDFIDAGSGADILFGYFGNDTLLGGNSADSIYGGAGNDSIEGGSGDDLVGTGLGADTVVAGAGNDTISGALAELDGDELVDFGSDDVIEVLGETISIANLAFSSNLQMLAIDADMNGGSDAIISFSDPTLTFAVTNSGGNSFITAFGTPPSTTPTNGNDLLTGNAGDDTINALAGNDTVDGLGGDDLLIGGPGVDIIEGGANGIQGDTASWSNSNAAVTVDLSANPGVGGHAAGDVLSGIENLFGSNFGDVLTGDVDDNTITGFGGDDTIDGGAGDDSMEGQQGNDVFISGLGADTINGGAGTADLADYSGSDVAVVIGINNGAANSGGHATGDVISTITENLTGSAFDDEITGNTLANVLIGGDGNDTMNASSGNDTLLGGDGDDLLFGSRGRDTIDGGSGEDTASWSNTDLRMVIDLSTNFANGSGHAGGDTLISIENAIGGQFNDVMTGDAGDNRLQGLAGNDVMDGGVGNDTLVGNGGVDELRGGAGDDELQGGAGIDEFIYDDASFGADTIIGFGNSLELLVFRGSGLSYSDLTIATASGNTTVTVTADASNQITLQGITTVINEADFLF